MTQNIDPPQDPVKVGDYVLITKNEFKGYSGRIQELYLCNKRYSIHIPSKGIMRFGRDEFKTHPLLNNQKKGHREMLLDYQTKLHEFINEHQLDARMDHSIIDEILRLFDETLTEQKDLQALSDRLHEALNLKHELVDGTARNIQDRASQPTTNASTHLLIQYIKDKEKYSAVLTGFCHCFAIVKEMLGLPEPSDGETS